MDDYKVKVLNFTQSELVLDPRGMALSVMKKLVKIGAHIINSKDEIRLVINADNLKNSTYNDVQQILSGSFPDQASELVELKDYQREDVDRYLNARKIIDASDMGTGKTAKAIIAAYSINGAKYIICPKSLILNWKYEIYKFLGEKAEVRIVETEENVGSENAFYLLTYGWLATHINVFEEAGIKLEEFRKKRFYNLCLIVFGKRA